MKFVSFFLLFVAMLGPCGEGKAWSVTTDGTGKGGAEVDEVTQTLSLAELETMIYPIVNPNIPKPALDKGKKVKMQHIGQIAGANIYDFIYPLADDWYKCMKMVVVEKEPNQYIPVYSRLLDEDETRYFDDVSPASFIIAKYNLLVSEFHYLGSGGFVDSFYLYIPPDILKNNHLVPTVVDFDNVKLVKKLLDVVVPKGYGLAIGDPFNIETLHFYSCITDQAHCFGGEDTVDIQYTLTHGVPGLSSFEYKAQACCKEDW